MRWKHTHIHTSMPNKAPRPHNFTLGTQALSVCVHSLARERRYPFASNRPPASLCYHRPRRSQRSTRSTTPVSLGALIMPK
ncbi:hypothetical protein COCVIDRAFT_108196 [Bipolaris victoriae FI3]|uniref:Uncharacterized protein n=1 Tax=Bipolaris victoriae (strain FI3) TaxID=930091 RepID=W7ECR5_BIPV3|nr:hypothetical protein COCVIDRAFT_108196 [Bipolaris victoriae FI3]